MQVPLNPMLYGLCRYNNIQEICYECEITKLPGWDRLEDRSASAVIAFARILRINLRGWNLVGME